MASMEDYWKWDENFSNLWRLSTEICRKMKDHQQVKNVLHRAGKVKTPACKIKKSVCKTLRVGTKNEDNFEIFLENF